MPYIPHTQAETTSMLEVIGVKSMVDLFDEIPESLRITALENISDGLNEMQALRLGKELAQRDHYQLNFIGAGAYEHHIPAAVWDIASRGEFLTSYTPYQAEASQGTLQLLYEYQTMITRLTAMDVANASLYDGASALAEAILMAVRANRHSKSKVVLLPLTLHPAYRAVVTTLVGKRDIQLKEIHFDPQTGCVDQQQLAQYAEQDITALVIPQPNFFGVLDDIHTLTNWAHQHHALAIAVVNPMSLAILQAPGKWGEQGADIVCGELQPFGMPLASGGPYAGFMACKQEYVRQMPGRIIGRTVDTEGKAGFTLTLQAREQHIRRSKATSNICTNQGLLVTAATIYMSLVGATGLQRVASQCHSKTAQLLEAIADIDGIEPVFTRPFFHEIVLRFAKPLGPVLDELSQQGILAGYAITEHYPQFTNCLLVCVTETKTDEDLDIFVNALRQALA